MDWVPVSTNAIAAWAEKRSAPRFVVVDKPAGTVTFLAEATGLNPGDTAEFFVCGPLSDRSYESMFMSLAKPEDIVSAISSIGVPRGVPTSYAQARFWPQGERLGISVIPVGGAPAKLSDILKDAGTEGDRPLETGVVYTGGELAADGSLVAATNIPCAVFALYNHSPSSLQLASSLEQSGAYGRFKVNRAMKAGDLVEITLSRGAESRVREFVCTVSPKECKVADAKGAVLKSGTFQEAAGFIREESGKGFDVYLRLSFAPDTPVAYARACASLFAGFDGTVAKLNGFEKGQLFARALVPDDKWRNRKQRVAQPFEIYPAEGGSGRFVFIEEYWDKHSESIEPELRIHEHRYGDGKELLKLVSETGRQGDKMFTAFVFLPEGSKIGPALETVEALRPRIMCFYVFEGIEPAAPAESAAPAAPAAPAEPAADAR